MLKKYENIVISTQVLFEFSYTMNRKFKRDCNDIEKSLEEFRRSFDIAIISYDTLRNALRIASKYKYSFPDSLIVATAIEHDCDILFSEDMHNDQIIEDSLKILNPFK